MSDRGTEDSPARTLNTRHLKRPPGKPSRLDQFADEARAGDPEEIAEDLGVTGRKEAKGMREAERPEDITTRKKKYRADIYRT